MQVDLPGLARMGGAVAGASDGFRSAYLDNEAETAGPADGWATGAALAQAGEAWRVFTGTLADQVRDFGHGLSRSAAELLAGDQAAADRVGAAGRDRPR
jgi:hypothetical protein